MEDFGLFDVEMYEEFDEYVRLNVHHRTPEWIVSARWFVLCTFVGGHPEPAPYSDVACFVRTCSSSANVYGG
jgi:hypothetical protein